MAYSNATDGKLYGLLPAEIRRRDAEAGEPLRALLAIVEAQADIIEGDIRQLGENAFIETCEPWVIPYIGDLVGTVPIFDASRVTDGGTARELFPDLEGPDFTPAIGLNARTDVAKTISYRTRKATPAMLEEMARDVTGWSAHVVEFFEHVNWAQWLRNHPRHHAPVTPDLRSVDAMDRVGRAWDPTCHAVDLSPLGQFDGWHGVEKIGFFLWRLFGYPLERVTARRLGNLGDFRFHFSVLGNSMPLFAPARPEGDRAGLATEAHVPAPYRRARFFEALRGDGDPDLPFRVRVDGVLVPDARIICRNLSDWDAPGGDDVAVDPPLGRLTLGPLLVPASLVEVDYVYGFPGNLGGGPYRRRVWQVRRDLSGLVLEVSGSGDPGTFATINDALTNWVAAGGPDALIRIADSRSYEEAISIDTGPASGTALTIEAADSQRPHLQLDEPLELAGDRPDFSVTLSGLLIEGRVEVTGQLSRLRLLHSTLVPGVSIAESDPGNPLPDRPVEPSIRAVDEIAGDPVNTELRIELAFSIVGPLRLPRIAEGLFVLDSIIDGHGTPAITGTETGAGPVSWLERVTIRGPSELRMIRLASEVIFESVVICERLQEGCLRFSYVRPGSETPRRYRCQPDLAERRALDAADPLIVAAESDIIRRRIRRRLRPEYASETYGDPAYLQLSLKAPIEITTGAEDGSEMGVWCHLKQQQREANLRLRLDEYLPFGLEAGLIYET
jgi:hypothetical protein